MLKFLLWLMLLAAEHATAGVPSPEQVRQNFRSSSAELLDRHGQALQTLRIDMSVRRHAWVELKDISPALIDAVLRAEDVRFYTHGGVDLVAAGKSAWDNLFRDRPRGASTITMQLAALLNIELQAGSGGRDWQQKWQQVSAARELEASWSKAQILEAYLNLLTFRGEKQGLGAASQVLFGKAPSGLNHLESAILAALIRAPNAAPTLVAQRACLLAGASRNTESCRSVHSLTAEAFKGSHEMPATGLAPQIAQKLLKLAAQRLPSTLDANLQRFASNSLQQQMLALHERNVSNGAIVVLDNASGEILAYVANAGNSKVDAVVALRQAGSTLKPFLYQLALEKKILTAASILDDSAIEISTPAGLYVPQNYDRNFKGYVSVRTSLGNSLNVPAVRTLVMSGTSAFHQRLKNLGLTSLTESPEYYGYALALGSAEVSLLELTNAYRTLANGGLASPVTLVAQKAPPKLRLLEARTSFIVSDILADRAARSITFGLKNELSTRFWSAVKTGTSKDMRDNWCIGYSRHYTVGVWVGNLNGEPMWDVSGVSGAAPIWRDVMDYLHQYIRSTVPRAPAGVIAQQITYRPMIEPARLEWFISGTESSMIELLPPSLQMRKIRYPGDGTIIALDPDIPADRQRIFFQAQAGSDLFWRLDQTPDRPVERDFSWSPEAGSHQLSLVDERGEILDMVKFQVRGSMK